MKFNVFVIVLLAACLSCSEKYPDIQLGDGYFYRIVGAQPVLHVPGNGQLWRNQDGRDHIVWPYNVGRPIVTNGILIHSHPIT